MSKRAVKIRPAVLPDTIRSDVMVACEQIHDAAKKRGWDLERLGREAGHAFQSFINWKKGHELPKIANLQDYAQAVGGNVRVLVQDAQHQGELNMASTESRMIAALIDSRLKGEENQNARREAIEVVKHYLGTLPHP